MATLWENLLMLVSTPIYASIILLELVLSHYQDRRLYGWKDTAANVYLMLLNVGIDLLLRTLYVGILVAVWQHRVLTIAPAFAYWLVLLLAEDFAFYWLHRLEHRVRLFWAVHVTHHSSDHFNFTVGFRSSVLQPMYRFVFFLPLAWFGFEAADILMMYSATQIWGILVHTRLIGHLGWFEKVFVTPSHHRVHHASNPLYLDKNMGMFLIVWDKLFGTFQEEKPAEQYQPMRFGLTTPLKHNNAAHLVLHEWQSIAQDLRRPLPWRIRLRYLLAAPGWSHDGSRQTSEQLRQLEKTGE